MRNLILTFVLAISMAGCTASAKPGKCYKYRGGTGIWAKVLSVGTSETGDTVDYISQDTDYSSPEVKFQYDREVNDFLESYREESTCYNYEVARQNVNEINLYKKVHQEILDLSNRVENLETKKAAKK
jgi:hypothetical protein